MSSWYCHIWIQLSPKRSVNPFVLNFWQAQTKIGVLEKILVRWQLVSTARMDWWLECAQLLHYITVQCSELRWVISGYYVFRLHCCNVRIWIFFIFFYSLFVLLYCCYWTKAPVFSGFYFLSFGLFSDGMMIQITHFDYFLQPCFQFHEHLHLNTR